MLHANEMHLNVGLPTVNQKLFHIPVKSPRSSSPRSASLIYSGCVSAEQIKKKLVQLTDPLTNLLNLLNLLIIFFMLLSEVCCHEYYREGTGTSHILNYNQLTNTKKQNTKNVHVVKN